MSPLASLVIALSLIAQTEPVEDPDGSKAHGEAVQAAMRKRLAEDRVRLQYLEKEERSIMRGMYTLDRKLKKQHRRAEALNRARRKLEVEIQSADDRLKEHEIEMQALRDRIGRRAAAMMRLRKTRLTTLLSNASSPSEHRRLRERLRLVLSYDAELVRELRERAEAAKAARAELDEKSLELDQTGEALDVEMQNTRDLRAERDALLGAIKNEKKLVDRMRRELSSAATKLASEIGRVRGLAPPRPPKRGGIDKQKGRLLWPVAGRVEVAFGKRVDPGSGMVLVHRGVDIRAPFAEKVRSVFAGTVRHVGSEPGFGRVVIVEHRPRWYSVYAHLEAIVVAVGDRLDRGELLGTVGDTGSRKGPYLYFELRKGRKAVDPLVWLSGA